MELKLTEAMERKVRTCCLVILGAAGGGRSPTSPAEGLVSEMSQEKKKKEMEKQFKEQK